MRIILAVLVLSLPIACAGTPQPRLDIYSPRLDSGIRGNGGDGYGGEETVGRFGGGYINQVTVPRR